MTHPPLPAKPREAPAKPRICTATERCGQCGTCIVIEYAGARAEFAYTLLIPLIDRALAKARIAGADWMREQAAKQLEVLRLQLGSLSPTKANREIGSNLAVKNGAALIRALPLAPSKK